eukprot:gb/GECG01008909.1/.p1 GENE.gb/GECG01008909.1/~~gb/GECG01008909.1/.p1  ORF type:complete len:1100 (+),score=124.17 gb/GECG01008909.1/:1-3300(+)
MSKQRRRRGAAPTRKRPTRARKSGQPVSVLDDSVDGLSERFYDSASVTDSNWYQDAWGTLPDPSRHLPEFLRRLERPKLHKGGNLALKTSEKPFLKRLLAMPLPWILKPSPKGKPSKDIRVFDYLNTPTGLPNAMPHPELAQQSMALYVAHKCSILLEEARAILQGSLEKLSMKLEVSFKDTFSAHKKPTDRFYNPPRRAVDDVYHCQVLSSDSSDSSDFFKAPFRYREGRTDDEDLLLRYNDVVLVFPNLESSDASRSYARCCFLAVVESSPQERLSSLGANTGPVSSLKAMQPSELPMVSNSESARWFDSAAIAMREMKPDRRFLAIRLQNLTTLLREYNAACVSPVSLFSPLLTCKKEMIYCRIPGIKKRGKINYLPNDKSRDICITKGLYQRLSAVYNDSQLAAILYCARQTCTVHTEGCCPQADGPSRKIYDTRDFPNYIPSWKQEGTCGVASDVVQHSGSGVSLIQGPPGTGKTSTLLGIVSLILAACPVTDRKPERLEVANAGFSDLEEGEVPTESRDLEEGEVPSVLDEAKRRVQMGPKLNNQRPCGRVLVCAPSNAAVDELLRRMVAKPSNGRQKDIVGMWDSNGDPLKPRIVRVGREERIHPHMQDLTLDAQVERAMKAEFPSLAVEEDLSSLISHGDSLRKKIDALMQTTRSSVQLELQAESLQKEIEFNDQRILCMQQEVATRKQLENVLSREIIDAADVIATTLSSSTKSHIDFLDSSCFDAIIVDEACQATETSALIPLSYFCRELILIGDPQQLEATTFSTQAEETGYKESLFERLIRSGIPVSLLDTQYRMDPRLSAFPKSRFYDNLLKDALSVQNRAKLEYENHECFSGLHWIDVHRNSHTIGPSLCVDNNLSKSNPAEAEIVAAVCKHLATLCPQMDFGTVGVISPYRAQLDTIKEELRKSIGDRKSERISVNTVDSFQGQEKDIVIISAVRSSELKEASRRKGGKQGAQSNRLINNIGFVKESRRMNVSLTRAKRALIVIGDSQCLSSQAKVWKDFVRHCQENGKLSRVAPRTGLSGPEEASCSCLETFLQNGRHTKLLLKESSSNASSDEKLASRTRARARPVRSVVLEDESFSLQYGL